MFLHIDLDCFFVSAAISVNPSLKNKPVAVISGNCYDIFGDFLKPGIILSANYEARAFGVKCAMPVYIGKNLCPGLITINTDFALYKKLSNALYNLLYAYTNEIEKYSIDEYFMDLNGSGLENNALKFAKNLQDEVALRLNLPCSLGLSKSKYYAKLATDLAKPKGVMMIESLDEVGDIDISCFCGIGKSNQNFLKARGIHTLSDALQARAHFMKLGKNGMKLYAQISGEKLGKINKQKEQKSLCVARSFKAQNDRAELKRRLKILCKHLSFELFKKDLNPLQIELKIRYKGFGLKSFTQNLAEQATSWLIQASILELFSQNDCGAGLSVDYLSVGASHFGLNQNLFVEQANIKRKALDSSLNKLRLKYGQNII